MGEFDFLGDFVPEEEAKLGFDGDFEPLPPGWYTATVVRAETFTTRAGGRALKVAVRVEGPSHAGRWVWQNLNLQHPTSQAANRIGRQQFSRLCVSCGFVRQQPRSPGDLIGRQCQVKVATESYNDQENSVIKGWRPDTSAPPGSPSELTTTPGKSRNPWG